MIIENIKSKKRFTINDEEWGVITKSGNDYKYKLIEDSAPLEVRSLRKNLEVKELKKTNKKA